VTPVVRVATDRKYRIVHIITRFITGGADENTLLSANWFAEQGHEVTLIYGDQTDQMILNKIHPAVMQRQVMSLCRPVRPHKDLQAFVEIRRLLREIKPEIVHTHTSKAGFIGRLACLGLPHIVVVHGIHILPFINVSTAEKIVYTIMERLVAPITDAFVSVSLGMRDAAQMGGIGRPENHYIVASGMNIEHFKKAGLEARIKSENDPVEVLLLAAYEPRKQQLKLLQHLAQNSERFKGHVHFTFAGHGYLMADCAAYVRESGLSDLVTISGFTSDPATAIAAADICIYCSTNEGLPRAIVQYAACGKPIVALDLPGLDIIIKQNINGFLCQQNDFSALSEGILKLTNDRDLRQSFAMASTALDLSAWSVDGMCRELNDIYETVLNIPK